MSGRSEHRRSRRILDRAEIAASSDESTPYPSNFYAWYSVFVLLGIYLNSFLDRQILGLLVEDIKATAGLSDTQLGFLMGPAFAIFYTIAGLPLGWLADRMSRRWLIAAGQLFWSLASVAFGLARGYAQMLTARVAVGVGEASLGPSAYSLVADLFAPHRLGRALSVYGMGIYLGGGLALLFGGQLASIFPGRELQDLPLAGERYGWQIVFFLIALPTIPLTLLLLTIREPVRRGVGRVRDAVGNLRPLAVPISQFARYWLSQKRTMLCHALGFSLLSFSGYGAAAWLPAFFMRIHDWTLLQAGTWLGLNAMITGSLGLFIGGAIGDWLDARGRSDSKMRVGLLAAVAWLPFGVLAPLVGDANLAFALLVPATLFSAMPWGIAPAAVQEVMPNQMRGQASALYLFIINLVGLGLGPYILPLVTDYVFADEMKVHLSLVITTTVAHVGATALLWAGLAPFRESRRARDRWLADHS